MFVKSGMHRLLALGGLVLAAAIPVSAQTVARQTILRGGSPLSGYGLFQLGDTEFNVNGGSGLTQTSDSYGLSGWNSLGFYAGAISSGFYDTSGTPTAQNDTLLGFSVAVDAVPNPTTATVTRNATIKASNSTGIARAIGFGGVSNSGTISFRVDSGSGNANAINQISATDSGYQYLTTDNYLSPTITGGGSFVGLTESTTSTLSVPTIGNDGLTLFTSFNHQVGAAWPLTPTPTTGYSPYGQIVSTLTSSNDERGSVTYNSTAGVAAVYHKNPTGYVDGVYVYNISTSGGTVTASGPTLLSFPSIGGQIVAGTNYFSRTAYSGAQQIAMNDNGDLATVAVVIPSFGGSDNSVRNAVRKVYLLNKKTPTGYAGWVVVDDSSTDSRIVTVNPLSSTNSLGVSSPAIDNDDNVYFSVTDAITSDPTAPNGLNTHHSIYKAVPNSSSNPTTFTVGNPVLSEGDSWVDSDDGNTYTVALITVQVASSDLSNANVRYNAPNSLGPESVQPAAGDRAGIMVQALTLVNGANPVNKYVYLVP